MKRSSLQQCLALIASLVLVLAACTPEQTPASAARTAAAVRTPAAPPSTPVPPPTLSVQPSRNTPQPAANSGAANAPTSQPGPATLTASPNPVPSQGGRMGTTTITWSTGQSVDGQVYVSDNGDAEQLFSSGPTGSQDAPWIKADHKYEFHLYTGSSHDNPVASVTVGASSTGTLARAAPTPTAPELDADPNPVPADDQELGSTTISWSTAGGGVIYVSQDGGPEQVFARGINGSVDANWICRGSTYEFRLYLGNQQDDPVKTLTVTRDEDAPDHEPPPVVDCNPPDENQ
jgi:hypothetical protein